MNTKMLILLVVSAATLSGCMVYPRHGYGGHRGEAGPTYIYNDGDNRHGDSDKRRGHRRHHDGERRDRDRDGTPDRYDRAPHHPNFR